MNGDMVEAVLDGRKTQARRPVKWPEWVGYYPQGLQESVDLLNRQGFLLLETIEGTPRNMSRLVDPGDLLYVRETFLQEGAGYISSEGVHCQQWGSRIEYCADGAEPHAMGDHIGARWMCKRPSVHMPKWAARIWLRVTDVRVEKTDGVWEWVYDVEVLSTTGRPEVTL